MLWLYTSLDHVLGPLIAYASGQNAIQLFLISQQQYWIPSLVKKIGRISLILETDSKLRK